MRILLTIILPGLLALAGCAHQRDGFNTQGFNQLPAPAVPRPQLPATAPEIIVTPEPSLSGKIVKVNSGGRFVILNFPIGHLPAIEQQMNVYHLGMKVGEVRVSGPQLDDNIAGDLLRGTAQVGDEVKEQ